MLLSWSAILRPSSILDSLEPAIDSDEGDRFEADESRLDGLLLVALDLNKDFNVDFAADCPDGAAYDDGRDDFGEVEDSVNSPLTVLYGARFFNAKLSSDSSFSMYLELNLGLGNICEFGRKKLDFEWNRLGLWPFLFGPSFPVIMYSSSSRSTCYLVIK